MFEWRFEANKPSEAPPSPQLAGLPSHIMSDNEAVRDPQRADQVANQMRVTNISARLAGWRKLEEDLFELSFEFQWAGKVLDVSGGSR